jgi:HD-like signal output (HDOD) protein
LALRKLPLAEAEPGMVLARAVVVGGTVLVQQDVTLAPRLISLLSSRGVDGIWVREQGADLLQLLDPERLQRVSAREELRFVALVGHPLGRALRDAVVDFKVRSGQPVPPVERPSPPPARSPCDDLTDVRRVVRRVRSLPTMPALHDRIDKVTHDPNASATDVARVIQHDPVFASSLLRIANSALYRRADPITTVTGAVSLLGQKKIRDLCLVSCVLNTLGMNQELPVRGFWAHALAVGAATRLLGERRTELQPEELFLAGLLHDIGRLFWLGEDPQAVLAGEQEAAACGRSRLCVERERLGLTHVRAGRIVAQHWRLPHPYVEAIAEHHSPGQATSWQHLCEAVHVGDVMAHALELAGPSLVPVPELETSAWQALGLPAEELSMLLQDLEAEFRQYEESMSSFCPGASGGAASASEGRQDVLTTAGDCSA